MTLRGLLLFLGLAAAACFLPPVAPPRRLEVRCIDPAGRDRPCAREFASVEAPSRRRAGPLTPLHDFAYAAADAGPGGCAWILSGLAAIALVVGLWSRGVKGALRRVLLLYALGVPLCLALLYASSFLDGRTIRLGREAENLVTASLHAQTDRTTGLLSPRDVVRWHWRRGFAVLNVSDRDSIEAGTEAARFARAEAFVPPILVTVGAEWHGRPDIVLVNAKQAWQSAPQPTLEQLVQGVHADGGALFVAHPWAKVPRDLALDDILAAGVDGMEIVNGVIHGGRSRIEAARGRSKALLGVIDQKFGPHVNAVTALDATAARTPEGVARAIRQGNTHVLYAVPGGTLSGEEWKARELGITGAWAGLRTLLECPRPRRAIWYVWVAGAAVLWWITTRERKAAGGKPASEAVARALFLSCAVLELVVPACVSWEVRGLIGTIPTPVLVGAGAVLAVPLLASSHILARAEAQRLAGAELAA